MNLQEVLRERLRALGFDVVRFVSLESSVTTRSPERGLSAWLKAGFQGEMEWMSRTAEKRQQPHLVLSEARSAILLAVNYWPGEISQPGPRWGRYALYQDYHDTLRTALEAAGREIERLYGATSADYRYYVDSGPVLERAWAERGGVGFVGKNAMLISREFGNWLILAEIFTRLELRPDPPLGRSSQNDGSIPESRIGLNCGHCTRCLQACPTNAIRSPGVVDANRCISYQTIENRGIIPRELRSAIGAHIYGCDICLEVCPWNRFAQESRRVLLSARFDLAELTLAELLTLTPERFGEIFRHTPIKRTKFAGLLRNACIVAANTQARECLDLLIALTAHTSPVVRAHAVWAVFKLAGSSASAHLAEVRSRENDPAVLAEYAAETEGV